MKSIKIYELFDWFGKLQSGMRNYKHDAKVLHVAAVSIRQAYYLAGHDLWVHQNDSLTGIVEKRVDPDCRQPWLLFDGSRQPFARFEHGDACKRELGRLLKAHSDHTEPAKADEQVTHCTATNKDETAATAP